MFLAPVASQYRMAKPTPANTKDDYDKKRCADQLRHNRNMQSGNQIVAIRHLPYNERRNRHGKQIYKQVVETQSAGMPLRRHQIMDRCSQRSVVPAQEERACPKKKQER